MSDDSPLTYAQGELQRLMTIVSGYLCAWKLGDVDRVQRFGEAIHTSVGAIRAQLSTVLPELVGVIESPRRYLSELNRCLDRTGRAAMVGTVAIKSPRTASAAPPIQFEALAVASESLLNVVTDHMPHTPEDLWTWIEQQLNDLEAMRQLRDGAGIPFPEQRETDAARKASRLARRYANAICGSSAGFPPIPAANDDPHYDLLAMQAWCNNAASPATDDDAGKQPDKANGPQGRAKKTRTPGQQVTAAFYDWAMENVEGAKDMTCADLYNAARKQIRIVAEKVKDEKESERLEQWLKSLPPTPDAFRKSLERAGIKRYGSDGERMPGRSVQRRDQT